MKILGYLLLGVVGVLGAGPVVTVIDNSGSDIVFKIVQPYDHAGCSIMERQDQRLVLPHQVYTSPILLVPAVDNQPSVVLQPVGYQDPTSGTIFYFMDLTSLQIDEQRLQTAYQQFCKQYKKNSYSSAKQWLDHWIGGPVKIVQHSSELVGQIINSSAIYANNNDFISEARSYESQGVFSRLHVVLTLEQKEKPGILPYIKVVPGQGAMCQLGTIQLN